MCGSKTQKTTQKTSPAPEAMAYYKQLMGRLEDVGQLQYDPYTGQRVAGFTPYQQQAMQGIAGLQGAGAGTLQEAVQAGMRGAAPISGADIQRYQDPYQQMVLDAMSAKMRQQEAEDISKLQGSSISAGAFGGDRAKLAQAQLMRNQAEERNMRMSELMSKGYSSALAAAQADREAATRGAGMLQSLAATEFTQPQAQLQALYGAGAQQQALEQQRLNVPYEQYLEARAFPYQQLQYLTGIGTGVGSQMGGKGVTKSPGPSILSQIIGAGTAAAAFMPMMPSDERLKENIEDVGTTHDGQTIYKYNYKGDPKTHIGLLAQEVEQRHPEAVGQMAGFKAVNYDLATRDAVHKAEGGGLGQTAMFQKGFIPDLNPVRGAGAPDAPAPAGQDAGLNDAVEKAMSLAEKMKPKPTDPTNPASWKTTTTLSPENPASWNTTVSQPSFFSNMASYLPFAHGGGINRPHYDNGGGTSRMNYGQSAMSNDEDKWKSPQIIDLPYSTSDLSAIINKNLEEDKAPVETSETKADLLPIEVSQKSEQSSGFTQPYGQGTEGAAKGKSLLGGLLGLSPEAEQATLQAGLAMMAGQSPFALSNIGAGGMAGVKYYNELMKAKQEQALKEKEIAAKANKLNIVQTDMVTEDGEDIYIDKNTGTYYVGPEKLELDPNTKKMQKKEFQLKEKQKLKDEADLNRLSNSLSLQISDNADTKSFIETLTPDIDYLTAGFLGVPLSKIPGTQAANVAEALETIKSRLGFDKLQAIRANSPTGAGLGNTTNLEIQSLQKSVRSLSISQSPEKLKENLNAIIKSIDRIEKEQKRQFAQRFGEDKLFEVAPQTGEVTDPANPYNLETKTWADEQGKPVKGIKVDGEWMDIRNYKP